jgi:hypothetical protein
MTGAGTFAEVSALNFSRQGGGKAIGWVIYFLLARRLQAFWGISLKVEVPGFSAIDSPVPPHYDDGNGPFCHRELFGLPGKTG